MGTESDSVNLEVGGGGVTRVNVPVCTCVRQESNREHSVSLCSSFHWHKRNVCGLGVVCSCVCGGGEGGGAFSLRESRTVKVSLP